MAAQDYFLKLDGIEGEATDAKHGKEIDIENWSFGETNVGDASSRGGMGAGKVSMQDFHFTSRMCTASPKLALFCATGQTIGKSVLSCRKAGGKQEDYYIVTLTDSIISSYQVAGGKGDNLIPMDQFSLNFSKIEWEYKAQTEKGTLSGTVKAGYDLKKNEKV
jgi:type VI secretion system secreted protein Hcp